MNTRIRELALQAGYLPDMFGIGHWDMPECKKFVELIIEECARRCDVVRENEGGDRQFGARLCADEIRYLNRRS